MADGFVDGLLLPAVFLPLGVSDLTKADVLGQDVVPFAAPQDRYLELRAAGSLVEVGERQGVRDVLLAPCIDDIQLWPGDGDGLAAIEIQLVLLHILFVTGG